MLISVSGTCGIVSSFRKIKGHNDRTEKVLKILPEVSFMVLGLVHEFHMDSCKILWLLNTNLIQEDIHHMDRNILGNCMLYCDELFLTLIPGLSVKFAT
jgi:hypothetical protein